MHNNDLKNFDDVWIHFETLIRGKLSDNTRSGKMDINHANIILDKSALVWFSGAGTEGKWLADFSQAEPEKGKEISRLLRSELTFSDNIAQKNNANYIKYGVPVAGGIAANAIAKSLGAGGALSGAAGAAAMAAMYPVAKSYSEDVAKKEKSIMLDAYITQLQLCKKKIEAIIEG